jgi:hypothetical protein
MANGSNPDEKPNFFSGNKAADAHGARPLGICPQRLSPMIFGCSRSLQQRDTPL